jgi:hypothetical protein
MGRGLGTWGSPTFGGLRSEDSGEGVGGCAAQPSALLNTWDEEPGALPNAKGSVPPQPEFIAVLGARGEPRATSEGGAAEREMGEGWVGLQETGRGS